MNSLMNLVMTGLLLFSIFSSAVIADDDIDRTKRPSGKLAPKVELPAIQKTTLKNGLDVWLVEHHELPTVAFNLVIQSGADHDPVTQPGLATMTADVLDEGTKTRSSLQIAEELEAIGTNIGVNSSLDGTSMTMNVLSKHVDKALDVFSDVLTNPTFPQKEFDRLKKQRLTTLVQQKDRPTAIAEIAYSRILYGSDHPYGNNPSGSEASLGSMAREDLVKFYETNYRPGNATLIIVGDAKMDDLAPKLEHALASWGKQDVTPFMIPVPKPIEKREVYLIDKPGAAQSEVRIGYPAVARNTPDYFPAIVMNRMLGGQFTSRINLNLRERHGYTYGARSAFNFQKGVGPFTASGAIVTEKTDSSIIEFLNELNAMREKGLSADELDYAKKGMVGTFALSFETPAQIAGSLQNIILYGLPEDYYRTYLQSIESVTLDDVQRVSKKYLDTSKMAIVVVGDLAKIKSGIVAANFGNVLLCDTDGKPLP